MNSAFPVLDFLSIFCLGLDLRSKYFIACTWSREERASEEPFCRLWLLFHSLIFSFRKTQLSPCRGQTLLSKVLVVQKSLVWWWKVCPLPATGLCVPHTWQNLPLLLAWQNLLSVISAILMSLMIEEEMLRALTLLRFKLKSRVSTQ